MVCGGRFWQSGKDSIITKSQTDCEAETTQARRLTDDRVAADNYLRDDMARRGP